MGRGDVEKMTVVDTDSGAAPMTHFRVPAREMLLDEPLCCPLYGALTFDGLAIDCEERVHLVVRTAAARAYLGPRHADVTRRAHILVVALVDAGVVGPDRAVGIAGWLGQCWYVAVEEISAAAELAGGSGLGVSVGRRDGEITGSVCRLSVLGVLTAHSSTPLNGGYRTASPGALTGRGRG
jgi:hypothetical protein